jgi:diguanylate cyclase (GGDEF)-like protein
MLAERVVALDGREVSVSVSIGLCEWREGLDSPDAWLAQADQALYAAKGAGRNRLCVAPDAGS